MTALPSQIPRNAQFRVALYSEPLERGVGVEQPPAIQRISQPLPWSECAHAAYLLRRRGFASGIVADTRPLAELAARPERQLVLHQQDVAQLIFIGSAETIEEALELVAKTAAEKFLLHQAAMQAMPQMLKSLPAPADDCCGEAEVEITLTDPLPKVASVPASREKWPWWERLLMWLLGQSRKEPCRGQ